MKDIRAALRGFVLADAAVNAACGGRMYTIKLPQGMVQPSLVFTRITGMGDNKSDGATGLSRPRIQIDAWGEDPDQVSDLANKVKDRLDGYRGPMTSQSNAVTVYVQGVFFDMEREGYDADAGLYYISRDYFVWNEER